MFAMKLKSSSTLISLIGLTVAPWASAVVVDTSLNIGYTNTVDGSANGTIGRYNDMSGGNENAFIVGRDNSIGEENETLFIFGEDNVGGSEDDIIFIVGSTNTVFSNNNIALGLYNYVNCGLSQVIGYNNYVTGSQSQTIGTGLITDKAYQITLGTYNDTSTVTGEATRILVVGNGNGIVSDPQERSNAMVVYETGDVSIQDTVYAKGVMLDEAAGDISMGTFTN